MLASGLLEQERAIRAALQHLEPAPDAVWLAHRCGRLSAASADSQHHGAPVPADLAAVWNAGRTSPIALFDRLIGIGLRRTSPDPVNDELAQEMLVLAFTDPGERELFTTRVASVDQLEQFGRLLGTLRHRTIDEQIATVTQRILHASQASRPADVCHAVAAAIRSATGFDGHCAVLRVPGDSSPADGDEYDLEVVSLLQGDASSSAPQPAYLRWSPLPGTAFAATGGRVCYCSRLYQAESGAPAITTDRYEVIEGRLTGDPCEDQDAGLVNTLMDALRGAGLFAEGTCVTVPLFEAGDLEGFLVTTSRSDQAFSGRDMIRIWQLGLLAVQPLARARRLDADFGQARDILGEAAALDIASSIATNRQLKGLMTLLCERLRRVVRADSVVLLPYDHRLDTLIDTGIAHAGRWRDRPRSKRPSPMGVVHSVLREKAREINWSVETGPAFEEGTYVRRHGIGRFHARALFSPTGSPIGVVVCNWLLPSVQLMSSDSRRIKQFADIAAEFLRRQTNSFNAAKLLNALFELYGELLVQTSMAFASEDPGTARQVRDTLLSHILQHAMNIVGGTVGLFAMPSVKHDGLDATVTIGRRDDKVDVMGYGQGTTGACALLGLVVVIPDSQDPSTYPPGVLPIRRLVDSKSEIAYPVQAADGRLLGVIDLENQIATHAFVEADVTPVLQPLAQVATLVIQLTDSIAHLSSIARLSGALDDVLGESEEMIARVALEEVQRVTGAFAANGRMHDPQTDSLVHLAHIGEAGRYTGVAIPLQQASANTAAYNSGKTVRLDDVRKLRLGPVPKPNDYLASRLDTRSEIAVPVSHHSQILGVLSFEHRQPGAFVASEGYLGIVARQVGHALSAHRDSQRRLSDKSREMVTVLEVLGGRYLHISQQVAEDFDSIRREIEELRLSWSGRGIDLTAELNRVYALTVSGIKDADALLAGAAASYEHESAFDVRDVLLGALPTDRLERVDLRLATMKPAIVWGREQMLRWVFREVIDNSERYGGPAVHIRVGLEAAARGRVVVSVEDDGPGIPEADLQDLFAIRNPDKPRRMGSGLAMVAAHAFLETMRGSIEATNVTPHGLRVAITLPLRRRSRAGHAGDLRSR